jgi:hypothetical protein
MNNVINLITNDLNDRTFIGNINDNDMSNYFDILTSYGKECYKINDISKNIDINTYITKIRNLLQIKKKAYFDMVDRIHIGSTLKVRNYMLHKIELYVRSNVDNITFIYYILENEQLNNLIFYEEINGVTKLTKNLKVEL